MQSKGNIVRKQMAEMYEQFCSTYHPGPMTATQFCAVGCKLGALSQVIIGGRIESIKSACPNCKSLIKKFRKNCVERIVQLILECKPLRCNHCGGTRFERKYGHSLARCWICGKSKQVTAEVQFFHRVKTPEDRLYFFIALRSGIDFNAKQFSDTLQKSSNTGVELERKIDQVMLQRLKSENRLTSAPLPEFMQVFTTRRDMKKPESSETLKSSGEVEFVSFLPEYQERLYDVINDNPIHTDVLAASVGMPICKVLASLAMLELDGRIISLPGNFVARA
jgi:hypothetical protein